MIFTFTLYISYISFSAGEPEKCPELPEVKTESQIKLMHESCKLARFVLDCVAEHIKENMTTNEIDVFAHELIVNNGAYPSPLNYKGRFLKSIENVFLITRFYIGLILVQN